jgi:hypothetical protein
MSTATALGLESEPRFVMVPVREKNGLGVAGFLIAFIGLFVPTGILAILGLLISLVALGRSPRGLAALGVITGLFGTVLWLGIMVIAGFTAIAAGAGLVLLATGAFVLTHSEVVEVTADMINVSLAIIERQDRDGRLPDDPSALGLAVSTLTDPWGNRYRFEGIDDGPGFDVYSAGGDGQFGTEDDLALSRLKDTWVRALRGFGERFEELGERLERLDCTTAGRPGWELRYERRALESGRQVRTPSGTARAP